MRPTYGPLEVDAVDAAGLHAMTTTHHPHAVAARLENGPYIRPPILGSFVNLSFIAAPNFSWDTLRVSWESSPSVGRSPLAYSCNFSCVPSGLSRMHLCGNQILRRVRAASSRRRSTPSTRHLLDGVAMTVPHHSTEPTRLRHRREMTS